MSDCWAVLPARGASAPPMLFATEKGAKSYVAIFGGQVTQMSILDGTWYVAPESSWITYDPSGEAE